MPANIGKSRILLIDTPGFDDAHRTDSEILTEIARLLSAQYKLGVQLKGIIYVHRITDIRYTRSAVKTFEICKKICGDAPLKNVLLVTTRWSEVDEETGSMRERQLKENFWAYMLHRGSHKSRFHGDRDSAIALVSQLLNKDTIVLDIQRQLVDEGKKLNETTAGSYVNNNIEDGKKKYQQELEALEKLKRELLEEDRAMKRQIQQDWAREQARLKQLQEQQVSLQKPVAEEVQQEIKKKRSTLSRLLPFVPSVISLLGSFVGIPPGTVEIFSTWFAGMGFSFQDLFSNFSF